MIGHHESCGLCHSSPCSCRCDCELGIRQWNPNTQKCNTCGLPYKLVPVDVPPETARAEIDAILTQAQVGIKHDSGKLRMSLLPGIRALERIAEVMQWAVEVKGYPQNNWQLVDPVRYRDAFMRHVAMWLEDPKGRDPESGKTHLQHIGTNVMMLLWHRDDQ